MLKNFRKIKSKQKAARKGGFVRMLKENEVSYLYKKKDVQYFFLQCSAPILIYNSVWFVFHFVMRGHNNWIVFYFIMRGHTNWFVF